MSDSKSLGIAFALLVVGFVIGFAVSTSSTPPPAPTPAPTTEPKAPTKISRIFVPPETREPVLEILRNALLEPDAFARVTRLASVLPALGPDAIPEVRAALDDMSVDRGAPALDLMLRWWAKNEPTGATNWAFVKAPRGYKTQSLMAAVETWATMDPEAAWAHIQTLSLIGAEFDAELQIAMVRGWFNSGHPGLTDFIQSLGPGATRQRCVGVYAREIIQRDGAEAAIRWADSVPEDDAVFKGDVYRQVGSQVALAQPELAVPWCDRVCDGPFGRNMRQLIAQRWAAVDGIGAMEWVSHAPIGELESDKAVQGAFRGWLQRDREGLLEWVDEMGAENVEPWFQPTVEVLAVLLGKSRGPLEGMRWASAITDPEGQTRTKVTVARNWKKSDPDAVEAWMDENQVSDDFRSRVHWEPPKRGPRNSEEETDATSEDDTSAAADEESMDDATAAAGDESMEEASPAVAP